MKKRAILIAGILAVSAWANQDTIKLERSYKANDADKFKLDLLVSMAAGEAAINMNLTQTVKRIYDNGDADIESKSDSVKLKLNGQEIPNDAIGGGEGSAPTVQRFDKYFRPVAATGAAPARGLMNQFNFMRYGVMLSGQDMKVGETMPVTYESKETKTSITGTAKLLSVTNGVAKIESAVKVKNPETGDKPIDLKMTSEIEVSSAKPVRVDGVVTDLPVQSGMEVHTIKFTLVKS